MDIFFLAHQRLIHRHMPVVAAYGKYKLRSLQMHFFFIQRCFFYSMIKSSGPILITCGMLSFFSECIFHLSSFYCQRQSVRSSHQTSPECVFVFLDFSLISSIQFILACHTFLLGLLSVFRFFQLDNSLPYFQRCSSLSPSPSIFHTPLRLIQFDE